VDETEGQDEIAIDRVLVAQPTEFSRLNGGPCLSCWVDWRPVVPFLTDVHAVPAFVSRQDQTRNTCSIPDLPGQHSSAGTCSTHETVRVDRLLNLGNLSLATTPPITDACKAKCSRIDLRLEWSGPRWWSRLHRATAETELGMAPWLPLLPRPSASLYDSHESYVRNRSAKHRAACSHQRGPSQKSTSSAASNYSAASRRPSDFG